MRFIYFLIATVASVQKHKSGKGLDARIPDFYDEHSGHAGPRAHLIPERYKGNTADRTMHHVIRYYGSPELGKCNDGKPLEGEHETDWRMPTNFVGEFPDCGKPIPGGRMWLTRKGAEAAAKDAIDTFLEFKGPKLDAYMKENFETTWKQFDVLNEGKIDIEMASTFLRRLLGGDPELTFGLQ